MTTKDELNGQAEKRTCKNDETMSEAEIWYRLRNHLPKDEFPILHGGDISAIEEVEAYHKYRVNSINYEDRIREIKNWMIDNEIVIIKRDK